MPEIKLKQIISCNSEDPQFPADNLLKSGSYKTWKCLPGVKEAVVLIQLGEPTIIHSLHIGNLNSAFVEVFVARASSPNQERVLLPASSFMNPSESRTGKNRNQVRLFKQNQLSSSVARQKWDQVKIVCTQPFNKTASYGISFITLQKEGNQQQINLNTTPSKAIAPTQSLADTQLMGDTKPLADTQPLGDTQPLNQSHPNKGGVSPTQILHTKDVQPTQSVKMGSFTLMPDEEDDICVGSMFSRRKEVNKDAPAVSKTPNNNSVDERDTGKTIASGGPPAKKSKVEQWKQTKQHETATPVLTPKTAAPVLTPKQNEPSTSAKVNSTPNKKAVKKVAFNELLSGVTVVLSGYVNPERAQLRTKACDMGAKYAPEWKNTCTHLVCAVSGTPKFNQVKGKGNIVKASWLQDCHKYRKRYSWRKYALDKSDATGVYSDEEVEGEEEEDGKKHTSLKKIPVNCAVQKNDQPTTSDRATKQTQDSDSDVAYQLSTDPESSEEEDTDNEIEKVTNTNNNKQQPNKNVVENKSASFSIDDLPDFLSEYHFLLYGDFEGGQRKQVVRFITAFGGTVEEYMGDSVTHVVTNSQWTADFEQSLATNSKLQFVKPQWILDCAKHSKMVPCKQYLLHKC